MAGSTLKLTMLLGCVLVAGPALAQGAVCINNTPNPYKQIENWSHTSRPWASSSAVSVDASDNIWVADRCAANNGCDGANSNINPIWELSSDGQVLKNFGAGLFVAPHSITIDRKGHLWITDFRIRNGIGNQVTELDQNGKVLLRLGKPGVAGSGPGEFNAPNQVRVGPDDNIYVSEGHDSDAHASGNSRIQVFSAKGKYLYQFGSVGSGPSQFNQAHDFDFDSKGRMYIADRNNNRVVMYALDGKLQGTWKDVGAWKQFGRPTAVMIDKNDNLYVADSDSADDPKAFEYNPDCAHGIRIGNVNDGKVVTLIPPPPEPSPSFRPVEGMGMDSKGNLYGSQVQKMDVVKYTRMTEPKPPGPPPVAAPPKL